jgi:hypothetical protein
MSGWLTRRPTRWLTREIDELSRAATGPDDARALARGVRADLGDVAHPSSRRVAEAVAARCTSDAQRSTLAAYLHLCRALSLEAVGAVFGIDAAAARRLVERGSGTAPVTAADDCRGWALVVPRSGRTPVEHDAAAGHLALCRRCRNKLQAYTGLEQRVAVAGTTTLSASVIAAVGRAFAGGQVATSAAGALTGPVVALSTAAALTLAAGGFAIAMHQSGGTRTPAELRRHAPAPRPVDASPVAVSRQAPTPASTTPGASTSVREPLPAPQRSQDPGLPGTSVLPLPLPSVSGTSLPLPLPTESAPALPLPTVSPLPLPTLPSLLP